MRAREGGGKGCLAAMDVGVGWLGSEGEGSTCSQLDGCSVLLLKLCVNINTGRAGGYGQLGCVFSPCPVKARLTCSHTPRCSPLMFSPPSLLSPPPFPPPPPHTHTVALLSSSLFPPPHPHRRRFLAGCWRQLRSLHISYSGPGGGPPLALSRLSAFSGLQDLSLTAARGLAAEEEGVLGQVAAAAGGFFQVRGGGGGEGRREGGTTGTERGRA